MAIVITSGRRKTNSAKGVQSLFSYLVTFLSLLLTPPSHLSSFATTPFAGIRLRLGEYGHYHDHDHDHHHHHHHWACVRASFRIGTPLKGLVGSSEGPHLVGAFLGANVPVAGQAPGGDTFFPEKSLVAILHRTETSQGILGGWDALGPTKVATNFPSALRDCRQNQPRFARKGGFSCRPDRGRASRTKRPVSHETRLVLWESASWEKSSGPSEANF